MRLLNVSVFLEKKIIFKKEESIPPLIRESTLFRNSAGTTESP